MAKNYFLALSLILSCGVVVRAQEPETSKQDKLEQQDQDLERQKKEQDERNKAVQNATEGAPEQALPGGSPAIKAVVDEALQSAKTPEQAAAEAGKPFDKNDTQKPVAPTPVLVDEEKKEEEKIVLPPVEDSYGQSWRDAVALVPLSSGYQRRKAEEAAAAKKEEEKKAGFLQKALGTVGKGLKFMWENPWARAGLAALLLGIGIWSGGIFGALLLAGVATIGMLTLAEVTNASSSKTIPATLAVVAGVFGMAVPGGGFIVGLMASVAGFLVGSFFGGGDAPSEGKEKVEA